MLKQEAKTQEFTIKQSEMNSAVFRKRCEKNVTIDTKINGVVSNFLQKKISMERCLDKLSSLKY